MACTIADDLEFGPAVQGCRDDFDFTLAFENDIFTILPCCLFLVVAAVLLPRRMRRPLRTISPAPQWTKLIVAVVHAGINLAILVLWHTTSLSPINIAGPALAFVSSAAVIIVSHFEHTRTVRPSTLLILFMGTLALFNAVKTRTLFIGGFSQPIAGFTASLVFLELLYVVVESKNKRTLLRFPWKAEPAEALDGILQRTVFSWILPIFLQGFRSVLTINDLYSLDNRMTSLVRGRKHIDAWQKVNKQKKYPLVRATFWALLKPLLFTIPPRIALIGFRFAQPFLINAVLTELLQPELSVNNMYGLIGASALVYMGLAFSTVLYQQKLNFVTTALRGGMVALIYDHTLRIPESKAIDSAAITHMSTDVERVAGSFGYIMEIWGQTAEVAIGIWLLSRQIGWICVAPIVVVVISTVSTTYIMRSVGLKQKIWVKAIQERVTFTLNSIKSIKAIKMMGYSTRITKLIQDLRVHELNQMRAFRSFSTVRSLLAMGPRIFGPFVTYILYAIISHYTDSPPLQTAQAFTSLAIISLVTNPAFSLLSSMGIVSQALGCFSRIADYLKFEQIGPAVELMHPTKIQQFAIPTDSARSHSYTDDPHGNKQSVSTGEKQISLTSRPVVSDLTKSMALDIERVAVRYGNQVSRTLNGVSLAVPKKTLTIILGPSGCGKTTLLNAILGELECEEGTIFRPMSMGFSGQDEWLPSGTLKALISGSASSTRADEADPWLDKVIWACDLEDLVNELPFGLATQFNMQAMTLSGGQRQRIALARAIYSRSELLLLDDVLSALDNRTELIILERLFGPEGLFKSLDTTVVLVTHSPRPLSFAQKIIHMNKTGSIDFDGDYQSATRNSTISALIKQFEQSGPRPPPSKGKGNEKLAKAAAIAKPPSNNDIMDLRRQAGDVTVYKYYFSSVRVRWLILFIVQMGLFTVFVQIQQIWLAWYASGTITSLALFCSIYAFFAVGSLAALAASLTLFFFQILPESANNLHERLLLAVMQSPFSFFVETDSGITLNRFSQDMTLIDGSLPLSAIGVLTSSFDCIAALVFVSLGSNYLALVVVPLVILLYGLQKFYLRTSRQIRFLDLEAKSPLYSQFLETLPGLSTIRALRWQDDFMKDHLHRLDNSQKPYYLLFCIQRWLNLVLDLAVGGMGVLVIVLSLLVRSSSAGPAFVGVALNAILGFNSSLASVMAGWINLETSLGAVARTKQFAETAAKEDRPEEVVQPAEHWAENAAVNLQHFTASYATSKDELKRKTVLHDLSLNVPARHKLGICGKTGSGKSSVLLALLRILEPTSGTVSIGAIEFTQMPRETLRQTLISIPQETLVLPGSVRFNLDPQGKYSDEDIQIVLSKCLLWTTISTNGGLDGAIHGLSKGQQQLFSIARAMLKKSDAPNGGILLLDEATSHLDSETDLAIQKVLLEEFKSYTVLCVAHRLETLLDLQTVIVMEKGEIIESGNPRALMANRNSALSRLRDGQ